MIQKIKLEHFFFSSKITDPDWQIRSVAMQLYYAQHHYYSQHNHTYTTNVTDLYSYIPLGEEILTCSELPTITTQPGKFVVQVMDLKTQKNSSNYQLFTSKVTFML